MTTLPTVATLTNSVLPTTRTAWVLPPLEKRTSYQTLELQNRALPPLGPTDVLISVRAVSLNYRDLIVADGWYHDCKPEELVPISDGAGIVLAIGSHVKQWKKKDEVIGIFNQEHLYGSVPTKLQFATGSGGQRDGWLATLVIYPAEALVRKPSFLTWNEAATLPCAGVTALNALIGMPGHALLPGDSVVLEGTGGVSLFALQLATALGARVVLTSSSEQKLDRVLALLPEHARELVSRVNYTTQPAWGAAAVEQLGRKANLILDIGGNTTLAQACEAVQPGGVIATIGFVADRAAGATVEPVNVAFQTILMGIVVRGVQIGSRELLERLCRFLETDKIHPIVDRAFEFEQAKEAYAYLASQKHVGKIVITMPETV